ncbi:MAG TPA: hypothetical protein VFG30_03420 [Polyangiales bacterium]|nr:hypothetical protein [Polyangiales bacterium]
MTARIFYAALLMSLVHGCNGCQSASIAKLSEKSGDSVHRDFSNKRTEWEGADVGATFVLGDGLRTGESSTAMLALNDGSRLSVKASTTIRFLVDGAGEHEQSIDVQAGEAVVFAGESPVWLRTHVGLAQLAPGTEAVLTREADNLTLRVDVGQATFRDESGVDHRLGPGERVLLDVGMAILRTGDEKTAQTATATLPAPPPGDEVIRANVMHPGIRARSRGGEWKELTPGEHDLAPATGLRLPANTEVQLTRGPERARLLGAGEYVVGEGAVLVEALRGGLQFTAVDRDVEVRVPGGRIVARAAEGGSEAAVRIDENEGVLEMKRGVAMFRGPSGERDVTPGDAYRWSLASEAPTERPEDVPPPDYSNLEVRAGESFVVHAPEVPVAVSVEFTKQCKARGLVELAQPKRRSSGEGRANLLLPTGSRSYTVRCLDAHGAPGRVVARGTAHVLADAGTRQLPLRAPTSLVDADGRGYAIYYQNQLPEVRVRWPNPPQSDSYKLDVDGTVVSVTSPGRLLASGTLRDGTHRVTFEAGQRKSRTTTVDVRFDNTAATASLTAPVDRAFKVGDTVSIEGLALPAWNVSVRDGTIEKVGADRFQGSVVTSAARPDIAVRLVHRRLGTHYYLRRASGSR